MAIYVQNIVFNPPPNGLGWDHVLKECFDMNCMQYPKIMYGIPSLSFCGVEVGVKFPTNK